MVRERDPKQLMTEACEILVETRGYRFAWIGQVEPGSKRVVPAACAGEGTGAPASAGFVLDSGTALLTRAATGTCNAVSGGGRRTIAPANTAPTRARHKAPASSGVRRAPTQATSRTRALSLVCLPQGRFGSDSSVRSITLNGA